MQYRQTREIKLMEACKKSGIEVIILMLVAQRINQAHALILPVLDWKFFDRPMNRSFSLGPCV